LKSEEKSGILRKRMGYYGFFGEKKYIFLKNLEVHEKTDKFRMNLKGYPTISGQILGWTFSYL